MIVEANHSQVAWYFQAQAFDAFEAGYAQVIGGEKDGLEAFIFFYEVADIVYCFFSFVIVP